MPTNNQPFCKVNIAESTQFIINSYINALVAGGLVETRVESGTEFFVPVGSFASSLLMSDEHVSEDKILGFTYNTTKMQRLQPMPFEARIQA